MARSPTHEPPDGDLADGQQIPIADIALEVLHTPGHAPGAVCFYSPDLGVVFTGDTLFNGGPGATGRSFSDHDLIVASISDRLMSLPDDTVVKTGHGDDTTIGAERQAHLLSNRLTTRGRSRRLPDRPSAPPWKDRPSCASCSVCSSNAAALAVATWLIFAASA